MIEFVFTFDTKSKCFNTILNLLFNSGGDGWWGAWGTEFISNVRAKSAETFSLVKQDLTEFVSTIQYDTSVTVAETAHNVQEKLKVDDDETDGSTTAVIRQGVSQWLGSISTALKENVSQMSAIVVDEPTSNQLGPVFDRAQTYSHQRVNWLGYMKSRQIQPHTVMILMVPSAITHSLFWTHYFYKIHRFEQQEKRKAALVERANKMEEEDIGWDDEVHHCKSIENEPVPTEQTNAPSTDDVPRESSTPNPCLQQTPTKHKRTTSNAESEGKDDLNRENSSNSSVDSSWSKLSNEELKQNNDKKSSIGRQDIPRPGHSPSHSEVSSSSVVVVPPITDKDVDWVDDDDDDDLDFGDDVNEGDSKKVDSKVPDDDDDDWETWE
ncbi:hypothetical protein QZH41_008971 [Actinostola sp. cb2023]|nr:hypothetical protein QZH41_008971 [Actinostola sp. cb2023]